MRDFYTSGEAAKKLNLACNTMRIYAKRFGIGKQVSGRWIFSAEDIAVLESRRKLKPVVIPAHLLRQVKNVR